MTFDSEYEPFFQPPGWIVGPIWVILYTCLALSITTMLGQRKTFKHDRLIVLLFCIQLILNLLWPSVFNSEHYFTSLVMLLVMIVTSLFYAYYTYKSNPTVSLLVWPYIGWISFAAAINTAYYLQFG